MENFCKLKPRPPNVSNLARNTTVACKVTNGEKNCTGWFFLGKGKPLWHKTLAKLKDECDREVFVSLPNEREKFEVKSCSYSGRSYGEARYFKHVSP